MKMDTLREICERSGCRDVKTLIQSGNVVFRIPDRAARGIGERLEKAIEAQLGFRPPVITRTKDELRDAVARNPFAGREDINPSSLLLTFLSAEPDAEARAKLQAMQAGPEEVVVTGREFYMYFPNGMGRPKITPAAVEKILLLKGTGRNWNVVTKLLALAEELDSA
jgi:uncharacterized protein (DUF1697 family)